MFDEIPPSPGYELELRETRARVLSWLVAAAGFVAWIAALACVAWMAWKG